MNRHAVVGALLVSVCLLGLGRAPAPVRDIVYTSSSEGQLEQIWRMAPDGSNPRPMTPASPGVIESFAVWSPDGRTVAFMSNRGLPPGRIAVFTMNADGLDIRAVSPEAAAFQAAPDFSPDGRQIVFSGGSNPLQSALHVMDVDGTGLRRLTQSTEMERCPRWSPDGKRILFLRGNDQLVVLDLTSGEVSSILPAGMDGYCGDWSPDGRSVAFSSGADGQLPSWTEMMQLVRSGQGGTVGQELHVLTLEGMTVRHLPQAGPLSLYPRWSRDGTRLVYHAAQPPGTVLGPQLRDDPRVSELHTIAADGSDLRRLTNNRVRDVHPNW